MSETFMGEREGCGFTNRRQADNFHVKEYGIYHIVQNKCSLRGDRHLDGSWEPKGATHVFHLLCQFFTRFSSAFTCFGVHSIKTWVWLVRKSLGCVYLGRCVFSGLYGMSTILLHWGEDMKTRTHHLYKWTLLPWPDGRVDFIGFVSHFRLW